MCFILEGNLSTMNIHCNFFISVNNFHSHWLRILCGHSRIPALLYAGLFSYLRNEPRVISSDSPSLWINQRPETTTGWGRVGLHNAPLFSLPHCTFKLAMGTHLTNSPHDGWKWAGTAPGAWLMANKCLIFSFTATVSTLAPLSTVSLSITRIYVLFPWECYSQAAVIVEKGSVKLIPTEVLIVDNNIICHLLRDICILWGVLETANSYLAYNPVTFSWTTFNELFELNSPKE